MKRRTFLATTGMAAGATFFLRHNINATSYSLKSGPVKGVNLGAITYSFRSMPSGADDLLGYLVQLQLPTVEMMGGPVEAYAGAPTPPPNARGEMTEAQKAEREAYVEDLRKWRLSAPMDKFKALRKKFNGEGISLEVVKFGLDRMSPEEIDYSFQVADILGAKGITLERSDDAVKKLAPYADKHKTMIGYHNHAEVNFNSWDAAVGYSKYNALNLDVGHYVAGTGESPIPLIQKYHNRILNIHLKDRKKDNGDNLPWGQGDTPLREILQLMKKEKYTFMGTIELEYPIPDGSDAVREVQKCIDFCRDAVA